MSHVASACNMVDVTYNQWQYLLSTIGIISQSRSFETVEKSSAIVFPKEIFLRDFTFCIFNKAKFRAVLLKTQLMST